MYHYGAPKNTISYYQEIGRAGRDGGLAKCVCWYSWADFRTASHFIETSTSSNTAWLAREHESIGHLQEYLASNRCRRQVLLEQFGAVDSTALPVQCGGTARCDNCTRKPPDLIDISKPARIFLEACKSAGRFGITSIVMMLLGSSTKSLNQSLHRNKYFGKGRAVSCDKSFWTSLARQLVVEGLLSQESAMGPSSHPKFGGHRKFAGFVVVTTDRGRAFLSCAAPLKVVPIQDLADVLRKTGAVHAVPPKPLRVRPAATPVSNNAGPTVSAGVQQPNQNADTSSACSTTISIEGSAGLAPQTRVRVPRLDPLSKRDATVHGGVGASASASDASTTPALPTPMSKRTLEVNVVDERTAELENKLHDRLRELRARIARKASAPAFRVCSDSILNGMVLSRPTTLEMLKAVDGVNLNFVTKYGKYFVREVATFVTETGMAAPSPPRERDDSAKHSRSSDDDAVSAQLVGLDGPQRRTTEMFVSGCSVTDIQVANSISREVALGHLCAALTSGAELDLTPVLTQAVFTAIVSAARRTNDTSPRADPRPILALLSDTLPDVDAPLIRLALSAHAKTINAAPKRLRAN